MGDAAPTRVAVYGATGRTGGLVVSELGRLGAEVVAGGRDGAALAELADRHRHVVARRVADVSDPGSLRSMLEGCGVVVNCAAPLSALGEPVLRAAIEAGAHYVDPAGEQPYIREVLERFGGAAEARGVAVVPALGFDYAPGDCIARLAAAGREPLREVVIAYAVTGAGVSRDALAARGATTAGREVVYRDGRWRHAPRGIHRAAFRFPPPLGRQPMQRYGSGEAVTVPRHTRTSRVTTLITASTWAPHERFVPWMPLLRPIAGMARRTPVGRLLEVAARRPGGSGTERGADRESGSFVIAAVAHGSDGSVGRGLVEGRDFHGLTAATLATGAIRLAVANGRAGALPPAAAFEPAGFLDALGDRGLRWRVE
jgi:short subunit dehydrogenase-like uncharacterized protein